VFGQDRVEHIDHFVLLVVDDERDVHNVSPNYLPL
jgi:hypothetical protein